MKKSTKRITAILIALIMLIGCSVGIISASAAPGYNSGLVNSMKEAMDNYEKKMDGTIYTNMADAYEYYVEVSRYLDRYYYANENVSQTYINQAVAKLNNAVNNMTQVFTPYTAKNPKAIDGSYSTDDLIKNATVTHINNDSGNVDNTFYNQTDELSGVLLTVGVGGSTPYVEIQTGSGNYRENVAVQLGSVVFLYDGSTTLAVPLSFAYSRYNSTVRPGVLRPRYCYPTTDNFSLNHYWHGTSTTVGYQKGTTDSMAYYATSDVAARGNGTDTHYFSNTLYYNGSLYDDEWKKDISSLSFYAYDSRDNGGTITIDANSRNVDTYGALHIYVINYKTLINAINEAAKNLTNVSKYKEGGLKDLITALDNATSYNPNTDFESVLSSYSATGLSSAVSAAEAHIKKYTEDLKVSPKADAYDELRSAIDDARALYYHTDADTTTANGVNPTVTNDNGASNLKYCTKEWETFANLFATIADQRNTTRRTSGDAFMQDAADVGSTTYDNPEQAAAYAKQLSDALAAIKEHKAGSDKLYKFPDEGGYKKANCEDDGLAVQYSKCPNCSEEYIDNNAYEIQARKHSLKEQEAGEVTCTQPGTEKYWTCTNTDATTFYDACGKNFEDALGNKELVGEPKRVDPTGHKFGETPQQEAKAATCFSGSLLEIWECEECHNKFTKENKTEFSETYATDAEKSVQNDAINHNGYIEHRGAVTATCQNEGNVDYYVCTNCWTYFHDQEASQQWDIEKDGSPIIPKLAHMYNEEDYTYDEDSQSCLTDGTESAECVYGCKTVDTRKIDGKEALDHDWDGVDHSYNPATCVDNGNIEYYHCERCGLDYYNNSAMTNAVIPEDVSTVIPATGQHSLGQHYEVKATCQSAGWNEYWECSVCHVLYDSADQSTGNEIEKLEDWDGYTAVGKHSFVKHGEQEATCLQDGWSDYWECSICDKCYSSDDQTAENFEENLIANTKADITKWEEYTKKEDAKHDIQDEPQSDATCVEEGYGEHFECEICHKWFDDLEGDNEVPEEYEAAINPNNHIGGWIENSEKAATCTATGFLQDNVQCKACGYYYADTEHTTEDERLEEADVIAQMIPHNQDNRIPTEIGSIEATCTTPGQQMYVLYCTMCENPQGVAAEPIDPIAHTPKHVDEKAPTCQSEGLEEHYECEVCGWYFAANDEKCTGSVLSRDDLAINSVGHSFTVQGSLVTGATCNTNAVYEYFCFYECGESEQHDAADTMTGHNMTPHDKKEATCLTDGVPETYYYCDKCKINYTDGGLYTTDVYSGDLSIPATGHSFVVDKLGNPATCEKDGTYTSYICNNDNCDLTKEGVKAQFIFDADTKEYKAIADEKELVEPLNPANHTGLKGYGAVAADCSKWESGYESHIYCSGCKNYYRAYDHYGEEPLENGNEDLKIDPVHTLEPYGENKPTCIEDGNIAVYVCSKCDAAFLEETPTVQNGLSEDEINEQVVIKAEGHTFGEYIEREATCVKEGIAGHYECSVCHIAVICDEDQKEEHDVLFYDDDDSEKLALGLNEDNHVNTEEHDAVVATCVVKAVDAYTECKDCGKLFAADGSETTIEELTHDVDPNNHVNVVPVEGTAPKCEVAGVKDHFQCADCQKHFVDAACTEEANDENLYIDPLEHVFTDYKPYKDATCTDDATEIAECDNGCGKTDERTVEGSALGHDFTDYKSNDDAACTEDGTETAECNRGCGETDTRTEADSAKGHTAGEPKEENRVEPTETKDGGYDLVVRCKVCSELLESTHYTLPATGSGEEPTEQPTETPSEQPTETPSEQPTEEPTETPSEQPTETPTEATTEATTEAATEAATEATTEAATEAATTAPSNSGNNSGTSPATGLAISIPVFSLAAFAGGFFSLGYARKKKNENED